MSNSSPGTANSYALVTSQDHLNEVLSSLTGAEIYALDTEFHREHTYFPQLALVQIAWADEIAIVDPLAVDIRALSSVLEGPSTAIIHASSQDLEVLLHACGAVPSRIFDTQVAAAFTGLGSPSLATLYERILGLQVPKANQLSDWLARPLAEDQLTYAANDVAFLPETYRSLEKTLGGLGRLEWVNDECDRVLKRAREGRNPQDAWRKVKELRSLRGKAFAVGCAVAAWREKRAAEIDQPVRRVMSDLAVAGVAGKAPSSVRDLARIRGVEERFARSGAAEELLEVVARAMDAPASSFEVKPNHKKSRDTRVAASLISALVAQRARELGIDASYLATRADIEAFLEDGPTSRLSGGWRAELVGNTARQIAEGEVAIAFNDTGDLVVEQRSNILI